MIFSFRVSLRKDNQKLRILFDAMLLAMQNSLAPECLGSLHLAFQNAMVAPPWPRRQIFLFWQRCSRRTWNVHRPCSAFSGTSAFQVMMYVERENIEYSCC